MRLFKKNQQGVTDPTSLGIIGFLLVAIVFGSIALTRNNFDIRQRASIYPGCDASGQYSCLGNISRYCLNPNIQPADQTCGTNQMCVSDSRRCVPLRFKCNTATGTCSQAADGDSLSIGECSASCRKVIQPSPSPRYACRVDNGLARGCYPLLEGQIVSDATYNSQTECNTNCVVLACPAGCLAGCRGEDADGNGALDCFPYCRAECGQLGCENPSSTGGGACRTKKVIGGGSTCDYTAGCSCVLADQRYDVANGILCGEEKVGTLGNVCYCKVNGLNTPCSDKSLCCDNNVYKYYNPQICGTDSPQSPNQTQPPRQTQLPTQIQPLVTIPPLTPTQHYGNYGFNADRCYQEVLDQNNQLVRYQQQQTISPCCAAGAPDPRLLCRNNPVGCTPGSTCLNESTISYCVNNQSTVELCGPLQHCEEQEDVAQCIPNTPMCFGLDIGISQNASPGEKLNDDESHCQECQADGTWKKLSETQSCEQLEQSEQVIFSCAKRLQILQPNQACCPGSHIVTLGKGQTCVPDITLCNLPLLKQLPSCKSDNASCIVGSKRNDGEAHCNICQADGTWQKISDTQSCEQMQVTPESTQTAVQTIINTLLTLPKNLINGLRNLIRQ